MKIFISGATGFIGSRLAIRLAEEGNIVHAIYRSENKTEIIRHPNIILYKGDILDTPSLLAAIKGCDQVYHVAAHAKGYDPDPSRFYKLNVDGGMNVLKAGINSGVKKFVFTSTAGVFGPSGENHTITEDFTKPEKYFVDYESSKAILESKLKEQSLNGIDIVLVNPTRVYGPGLISKSNSVTLIIKRFSEGGWRVIPGNGKSTGNYVHVDDVVSGHILAMEKGVSGENYILGGENSSYNRFFEELKILTDKHIHMFHVPRWSMLLLSNSIMLFSWLSGKDPLITPALAKRYLEYWNVSSSKAINDLGYKPIGLKDGIADTLKWLSDLNSMKSESG